MENCIRVQGARVNNLKNISVEIPRDKLVVLTGLSGSGKSSLAFDTIFAEGQRRYVESLSSYARMFLGQMDKPDVDSIDGLSPAISIDQKTTSRNPRSTVGTVTEIYDYLRLLWARCGTPHCPKCGKEIRRQTVDQIVDQIMGLPDRTKFQILSPVVRGKKGEHQKAFEDARRSGYARVRVDGSLYELTEDIALDKNKKHHIEVVVDRLIMKPDLARRLTDSVETASNLSGGLVILNELDGDKDTLFSQNYACEDCGISMPELSPRMFSFNNPYGACPVCAGLGTQQVADPLLIIPDRSKSILQGAIQASGWNNVRDDSISRMYFEALAKKYHFSLSDPIDALPQKALDVILYGTGTEKLTIYYERANGRGTLERPFEGVVNNVARRLTETQSDAMRKELEECMSERPCPKCHGKRLSDISLAVTVGGMNIMDFCAMPISEELKFIDNLKLTGSMAVIAEQIVREIRSRLSFLQAVGLSYLTLSRSAATLSGGESQRIRLATQIGSSLIGVLYILDEPSIGLHQRDNERLIETLHHLRDLGNTLIVVEHDEDTIRRADWVVDIGPGAGERGGEVIYSGPAKHLIEAKRSITGDYIAHRREIAVPAKRRKIHKTQVLKVVGARENNLKNIDVSFPLGVLTVVTGVSGSGKSSLVNTILYPVLADKLNGARIVPGRHTRVEGVDQVRKVIHVDQNPIGRTPRSNPATYTGVWDKIRTLFAKTPEAQVRGYGPGRFSFNVKGGRCEACHGDGTLKIEMNFLPDVYVDCEVCHGKRYNRETLEVTYNGKTVADILNMPIEEAADFFKAYTGISRYLKTLVDVGLGYIRLGQPAPTLSGGESQRVKLATELQRRSDGKTVYILDEPTTGLHFEDVNKLLKVLQSLVDKGNTVIVIEHNLDVIKEADWLIDLGPEGGDGGGTIVTQGTPEQVAECEASWTGKFLKPML